MAGDFALRIWAPGAIEPARGFILASGELSLDREFLGVQDGSVSRASNAPKLTAVGITQLRVDVPAHSARPVLAFEGLRFEAFQHDIPPLGEAWKIAPGQLSRPGRLARGASASAALVRQLDWQRPGPSHHLVLLPRAIVIPPGEAANLAGPTALIIGDAAVDITPADTSIPAAVPGEARTFSFRLDELEATLHDVSALDGYPRPRPGGPLRTPESEAEIPPEQLDTAAKALLDRALSQYLFFPVLEAERRPRLALAYERNDGSTSVLLSATDASAFVRDLTAFLRERDASTPTEPRRFRSTPPPTSALSTDVLARFGSIETRSPRFAPVLDQLANVATAELSILFLGESGTGKEHFANAIHAASTRASGPFVAVNCSALTDDLIESELFGHKRGAFTGAQSDRAGAFAAANGGTLLLDEIGDAPLRVQLALLRALENKTIRPVGSDSDRTVDVRVLAATSRNLGELIEHRTFRKDLYYRLAEVRLTLPPLRERREDIRELIGSILNGLGERVTVSREAEALLIRYDWPGNVRELRNALKRAVALSRGTGVLQAVHFSELGELESDGASEADTGLNVITGRLVFPAHVVRFADEIWKKGDLREAGGNRHEQRAVHRAALLCLSSRAPLRAWPKQLVPHWHRLFAERWATAEEGRGLRELVRQLGLDSRSEPTRMQVMAAVDAARRY
jgi:transcriptional regulator with AAA-type ATPase domain